MKATKLVGAAVSRRTHVPVVFRGVQPVELRLDRARGSSPVAASGAKKADRGLLVVYSVIREVREVARHDGSTVALVFAPDC